MDRSAWRDQLNSASVALGMLDSSLCELAGMRDASAAEISACANSVGVAVNADAVVALLKRPYVLVPTGDANEWYLVVSRVVDVPAIGWVVSQNEAFTVSRITRTMHVMQELPEWIRAETKWALPAHAATISPDHRSIKVTRGDAASFKERYGKFLGAPTPDGFQVKNSGKGWIGLVCQMIRDGILPYAENPVAEADWDATAHCDIQLRDYQERAVSSFLRYGALSMIAPMGAGKMFALAHIAAHLRGQSLILAPGSALVSEWRSFLTKRVNNPHVRVETYQWALAHIEELKKTRFIFLGLDELHRVPADSFSRLAYLNAQYRAGATGTPWREDARTPMIVALAGTPVSIPWDELIARKILLRPRVVATIVQDRRAKIDEVKRLLQIHRDKRALVFCDSLDLGAALARDLGLPFVHGSTRNQLQIIKSAPHCIVSRVADSGLDLQDLGLVVEFDFLGSSRTQSEQRMGRLTHSMIRGEHHTIFTADEYARYSSRLMGIRQDLGDIEVVDKCGAPAVASRSRPKKVSRKSVGGEIGEIIEFPAVAKLIERVNASVKYGNNCMGNLLRFCWDSPVSLEELRVGRGLSERAMCAYRAAVREGVSLNLIADVGSGRYMANRDAMKKIIQVSRRLK